MEEKGVTKSEGWKLKWEKANLKIEHIFNSEAIRNHKFQSKFLK